MKIALLLLVLFIALLSLKSANSAPVEDEIALDDLEERADGCTYSGTCTGKEDCCGNHICECNIYSKGCHCESPRFWANVRG
ncbi:hypothetical protein X975_12207, partial [Stegodyphus mimosarum]